MSGDQKNELESIIEEFLELDILVEEKEHLSQKAAILTKSHYTEIINERFKEMGFSCCFILSRDEVNPSGTTPVENVLFVDDYNDESLEKLLSGFDIIIVIWDHYSPSLFRKINSLCLSIRKPLAISYFDGDEGIFVPLLNMAESACFNDFEILRESSFYNLLDYQTMKEYLIKNPIKNSCVGKIYFETLINHTAILLNRMLSYKSLNAFAYSFDFERMVLSKTRLLKFPKCPACQGDKNIKHPFI